LASGVEFVSHAISKQSILSLVAAGFGVTLAVESQAALAWPGIVFRPVLEHNALVDVNLVWLAEREDATAGLFVAFVRDRAQGPSIIPRDSAR
jgi:DNA-binding transcriptional LysR family regulator